MKVLIFSLNFLVCCVVRGHCTMKCVCEVLFVSDFIFKVQAFFNNKQSQLYLIFTSRHGSPPFSDILSYSCFM